MDNSIQTITPSVRPVSDEAFLKQNHQTGSTSANIQQDAQSPEDVSARLDLIEDRPVAEESSMNKINVDFRHTFGQSKAADGLRCQPAELPIQVHS